jgi:hypothetical protein
MGLNYANLQLSNSKFVCILNSQTKKIVDYISKKTYPSALRSFTPSTTVMFKLQ